MERFLKFVDGFDLDYDIDCSQFYIGLLATFPFISFATFVLYSF